MATPLADREFIAIDHRFATFFSVSLIWDRILRFTLFALIRLAPDARAHFSFSGSCRCRASSDKVLFSTTRCARYPVDCNEGARLPVPIVVDT